MRTILILTLAVVLFCCGDAKAASAGGALVETRPILASGDAITGAGRVGLFGFNVIGLEPGGRLLFGGLVSDGRSGVFRSDGRSIEALWSGEAHAPGARLTPLLSRSSPRGVIAADGEIEDVPGYRHPAVYLLDGGEPRLVARVGAYDVDGRFNCNVWLAGRTIVNDAGSVVFWRETAETAAGCDDSEDGTRHTEIALYLGGRHALTRVLGPDDPFPGGGRVASPLHVLGLAADDTVITAAYSTDPESGTSAILASRDSDTEILLAEGYFGPQGHLREIGGLTTNASGEVLFLATGDSGRGLYRGTATAVDRVTALTGETPEGDLWPDDTIFGEAASLNARGDVALDTVWYEMRQGGAQVEVIGVLLFRADGSFETIRDAESARLDDAGHLVYALRRHNFPVAAAKHAAGGPQILLRTGDPAPGGGFFGVQGLDPPGARCMAPDGTIATLAFVGGGEAVLACGGEHGFDAVARQGDVTAAGDTIHYFDDCRWASDTELVFRAGVTHPSDPYVAQTALFRATADGIQRIMGSSDPGLQDFDWSTFAVNARGTVALRRSRGSSSPQPFLLKRRDGTTAAVNLRPGIGNIGDFGLLDDDTVVAIADVLRQEGPTTTRIPSIVSLVATENGFTTQVVTAPADPRLPGQPYRGFSDLFAAGQTVVVGALPLDAEAPRFLRFELDDTFAPRDLLPQPPASSFHISALTAAANVLFFTSGAAGGFYVFDGVSTQRLTEERGFAYTVAAINDHNNALFVDYGMFQVFTQSLRVSGPRIASRCALSRLSASPTATPASVRSNDGCQVGGDGGAWAPLVIGALLLVIVLRPDDGLAPSRL